MAVTWEHPTAAYPDIPGLVHGIVGTNPTRVQCDGCRRVAVGSSLALTVMTSGIVFNAKSGTGQRMCGECWKDAGWVEDYYGWKQL